ncbi:MAG: hypothetical protein BGO98_03430 [Myxococcales bacterium 68-20]|nr:MAG: hypothetical protein BGO98_03430 [Myxococcales bacterium 68-20]
MLAAGLASGTLGLACDGDNSTNAVALDITFPDEAGADDGGGIPLYFTGGGNVRFRVGVENPNLRGTARASVEALTPASGTTPPPNVTLLLAELGDARVEGSGAIAWPQRGLLRLRFSALGTTVERTVRVPEPTLTAAPLATKPTAGGMPVYDLCLESDNAKNGIVEVALTDATSVTGAAALRMALTPGTCTDGGAALSHARETITTFAGAVGVVATFVGTDTILRTRLDASASELRLELEQPDGGLPAEGGLVTLHVRARLNSMPVGGAQVTFTSVPETTFLPAVVRTDSDGGVASTTFVAGKGPAIHVQATAGNAHASADIGRP